MDKAKGESITEAKEIKSIWREAIKSIVEHVNQISPRISEEKVNKFIEMIEKANKVYVYGAGRSGLVAQAFAMRLMHLGIKVHVVGEITTPAIEKGDIFITVSGSGETTSVVNYAAIAKKVGAKIIGITSYPESTLGKIADLVLVVPGRVVEAGSKEYNIRQMKGEHYTLTPLGTLFEISVLILLDSLIAEMMARLRKSEEDLKARHATIE